MSTRILPAAVSFCTALLMAVSAAAGDSKDLKEIIETAKAPCAPNTLDWVRLRSSYTFESDFERGHHASGDAWYKEVEIDHRTPIHFLDWPQIECGQWYFRIGANYERWDFDNDGRIPLPNTLQSFSIPLAIEYVVDGTPALMLEVRPGFFFEHDVDADDFDIPAKIYAPLWYRQTDTWSFAVIGGVSYTGLRSYPILPGVGFRWRSGKWTVLAVPPEPRIIYQATDKLNFWIGGELAGGSFRLDSHDFERKPSLNRAVVTYSEWRAEAGFSYQSGPCTLDVGAGYAFQRKFDYHRADQGYRTEDGAPFVKAELQFAF